jgi:lauroyl/myristoyl acyltransferase
MNNTYSANMLCFFYVTQHKKNPQHSIFVLFFMILTKTMSLISRLRRTYFFLYLTLLEGLLVLL